MRSYSIAIMVRNEYGVLNRVTSMFRRRQFNITGLTVSETETEELSRITVQFMGEDRAEHQLAALENRVAAPRVRAAQRKVPRALLRERARVLVFGDVRRGIPNQKCVRAVDAYGSRRVAAARAYDAHSAHRPCLDVEVGHGDCAVPVAGDCNDGCACISRKRGRQSDGLHTAAVCAGYRHGGESARVPVGINRHSARIHRRQHGVRV